MSRTPLLALVAMTLVLVAGCKSGGDGMPGDSGIDSTTPDAGGDTSPGDSGPADSGTDTGRADAGRDSGTTPEGCNPASGVECDGDWLGRCGAGCADTECCSPVAGRFQCVARDEAGACPAADIWVDTDQIPDSLSVGWRYFAPGDCAVQEGCVTASGWRRLLYFATWTPNTGDADLYLGPPGDMADRFLYSDCHMHYHFDSYARYELRRDDGSVAAVGHKQAFCLLDFYRYPGTDPRGARYTCDDQGIQAGWQDVYDETLDCQWVDVTDIDPGDYTLWIDLNYEHVLLEGDYGNNSGEITITVPEDTAADDVTAACTAAVRDGADRSCGLVSGGTHTCTPGETVTVGCSSLCGLGSCTGDPFMRVCDASVGTACNPRDALGANDDSGCGGGSCGRRGDCCPQTEVTCPDSGEIVVYYAAYNVGDAATCTVATNP